MPFRKHPTELVATAIVLVASRLLSFAVLVTGDGVSAGRAAVALAMAATIEFIAIAYIWSRPHGGAGEADGEKRRMGFARPEDEERYPRLVR